MNRNYVKLENNLHKKSHLQRIEKLNSNFFAAAFILL